MAKRLFKSDEDLLIAIRSRDRDAFIYLYEHITGAIKHFVKTNGGQDVDADEIEQNVIVHLYEKVVEGKFTLHENTKLSTYLFAVGKNMWFKKSSRVMKYSSQEEIMDYVDDVDLWFTDDISILENEVVMALSFIDKDCKNILTLYYYDKKSMREISEILGSISEENIRKRKYKCLQKLKRVVVDKINKHG
jgi:RNA polymerase sigma factor (sigma-70 family)